MSITSQEKIKLVKELIAHLRKAEEHRSSVLEIFGYDMDRPYHNDAYRMEEFTTELVSKLIGDQCCWLDWFIYDNNCGNKKLKVRTPDGKSIIVNNVEKLIKLIENTNE